MNAETKAAQTVGDYDIRGPDFETLLVGPVTARIIDAARIVRGEWQNGFPNWALYRVVLAGDTHLRLPLRDFCVAYAVAHCAAGGVRTGLPVDELGCLAGWDAFYALLNHRWVIAGMDIADVAGVDPKTYRKVRAHVYRNLRGSLDEYWIRMQVAIRQVAMMERWVESTTPVSAYSLGRGFEGDMGLGGGSGNFIAPRRGSGD